MILHNNLTQIYGFFAISANKLQINSTHIKWSWLSFYCHYLWQIVLLPAEWLQQQGSNKNTKQLLYVQWEHAAVQCEPKTSNVYWNTCKNSLVTLSAPLSWCSPEVASPPLPFVSLLPGLRTVASRVRVVASGRAHWTGVAPENGASHLPVSRLESVGVVNLHCLSIFVAKAAELAGGAAAAGVRQAADWAHLRWVASGAVVFGKDAVVLTLPGLNVAPRCPRWVWLVQSRPLSEQWAQIQVVPPHVKGALTLEHSLTLDLDLTISPDLTVLWSHC